MGKGIWEKLLNYLPKIPQVILILLLGWIVGKILSTVLSKGLRKTKIDPLVKKYLIKTIYLLVLILFGILALSHLGLDVSAFVVSLGAGGLIIGFSLRNIISDFANGLMLFIYRPFRSGDYVKIGAIEGEISEIAIVNTQLLTPDGKKVYIPNRNVWGQTIINYTPEEARRLKIRITPGTIPNNLKEMIKDEVEKKGYPLISIKLINITGDLSQFEVDIDLPKKDYEKNLSNLLESLKNRFQAEKIPLNSLSVV